MPAWPLGRLVADARGLRQIMLHPLAGVLSAYGVDPMRLEIVNNQFMATWRLSKCRLADAPAVNPHHGRSPEYH